MKKDLTIVIVTFNSGEVIKKCLANLNADRYEIVVVDNASQDNSCQIVEAEFPKVKLIKNQRNLGYGRANNVGLRQAKTEFALVLNPDAFLFEDDIEISLNILKRNPQVALASPRNFKVENIDKIKFPENTNLFTESHFIIGGVLFMRLAVFQKIGFFDEEFFMFTEDNEISDRSIANGYKNIIIESARSFHSGGGSSKKSLRTTYRRFWHLGWSKSRYKQTRKGKFHTVRSCMRLSILYFFEGIFYFFAGNLNKSVGKFAFSFGTFSYLVGLKAFRKDGTPRG